MTYTTAELAAYVGGNLIGSTSVECKGASIDSRMCQPGSVFFAFKGENADGHEYIEHAIENGCSAVVVEKECGATVPEIVVSSSLKSLYDLALFRRNSYKLKKVIAVTGSVGKTTTKDIVAALLGETAVSSKKSYNNDFGVPLTVLAAEEAEYLVAEVGANDIGEIEPLAKLVQPDVAILTSIDQAHLEGFGNCETVLREKAKLLEALPKEGYAVVPESINLSEFPIKAQVYKVGHSDKADIRIETSVGSDGYAELTMQGKTYPMSMLGEHNAMNAALAVFAATLATGESLEVYLNKIGNISPPSGRLMKHHINEVTFLDDSYNANPASMRSALRLFQAMRGSRKVVVLGDMLELGKYSHAEHRQLGLDLAASEIDLIIFVGTEMKLASELVASLYEPTSTNDAMRRIASLLKKDDIVLLKGSRGIRLERIMDFYSQTKVST